MENTVRIVAFEQWITILIVSCVLLLTVAKVLFPRRFIEFVTLPLNDKYFLLEGKNDALMHPFNILLFVIQILALSLFAYQVISFLQPDRVQESPYLFMQLGAAIGTFIMAKLVFEKIIGMLFSIEIVVNKYVYQKLSYRNFIALMLLLCSVIFAYTADLSSVLVVIILLCLVVFNAIGLLYSYKSFRNIIFPHFFHFILYLCALEIAPYVLLYKLVS